MQKRYFCEWIFCNKHKYRFISSKKSYPCYKYSILTTSGLIALTSHPLTKKQNLGNPETWKNSLFQYYFYMAVVTAFSRQLYPIGWPKNSAKNHEPKKPLIALKIYFRASHAFQQLLKLWKTLSNFLIVYLKNFQLNLAKKT